MCYEEILNINQPKWIMPIIKNAETDKGHIFCDLDKLGHIFGITFLLCTQHQNHDGMKQKR